MYKHFRNYPWGCWKQINSLEMQTTEVLKRDWQRTWDFFCWYLFALKSKVIFGHVLATPSYFWQEYYFRYGWMVLTSRCNFRNIKNQWLYLSDKFIDYLYVVFEGLKSFLRLKLGLFTLALLVPPIKSGECEQ